MIIITKGLVEEGEKMAVQIQSFIAPGMVFLLTVVSGIWLSHSGKPYQAGIFTVHKLIALGGVVFMVIQMVKMTKGAEVQALFVMLLVLAAASVLALFFTGAMMSIGKLPQGVMLLIHQISPFAAFFSTAAAVYLLVSKS